MTLPASGPISFAQIRAEFGGPTPINILNYYRTGPYVQNHSGTASIPVSGPITVPNHFWGASAEDPFAGGGDGGGGGGGGIFIPG